MSSINVLMNNLEKLKLPKMKENINKYLDMMSDGVKTPLEAIDEDGADGDEIQGGFSHNQLC